MHEQKTNYRTHFTANKYNFLSFTLLASGDSNTGNEAETNRRTV